MSRAFLACRPACPQVSPTKLRRSPSMSALNEVIYGKQYTKDDQAFVFLLKVGRLGELK